MIAPRELKKLIKLCRESGVKTFKGDGFEFTLADDVIVQGKNVSHNTTASSDTTPPDAKFDTDLLDPEALLFWSTGGGVNMFSEGEAQS